MVIFFPNRDLQPPKFSENFRFVIKTKMPIKIFKMAPGNEILGGGAFFLQNSTPIFYKYFETFVLVRTD